MFDKDRFIEDCRAALREVDAQDAVRALVERAVREPSSIIRAVGEPARSGVQTIHRGGDLTILNLCWGPRMEFKAHDHRMWAVIGIYGGREHNTFFRRNGEGLVRHGTRELNAGNVARLGADVIHAVSNPLDQITAAIHVYGGDFFAIQRSEWDPVTQKEQPYDVQDTIRAFEAANGRIRDAQNH
jgi:predicted metal-dependent enzyme (double-stranded beta helix superfamily)